MIFIAQPADEKKNTIRPIVMSVPYICFSVSSHASWKTTRPDFTEIFGTLNMAVAESFSGSIAIW